MSPWRRIQEATHFTAVTRDGVPVSLGPLKLQEEVFVGVFRFPERGLRRARPIAACSKPQVLNPPS